MKCINHVQLLFEEKKERSGASEKSSHSQTKCRNFLSFRSIHMEKLLKKKRNSVRCLPLHPRRPFSRFVGGKNQLFHLRIGCIMLTCLLNRNHPMNNSSYNCLCFHSYHSPGTMCWLRPRCRQACNVLSPKTFIRQRWQTIWKWQKWLATNDSAAMLYCRMCRCLLFLLPGFIRLPRVFKNWFLRWTSTKVLFDKLTIDLTKSQPTPVRWMHACRWEWL